MRHLFSVLLLAVSFAGVSVAQPKLAKPSKKNVSTCKSRCSIQYHLCTGRATTKMLHKSCVAARKNCKGQCGG
jgi:hypothetical protein